MRQQLLSLSSLPHPSRTGLQERRQSLQQIREREEESEVEEMDVSNPDDPDYDSDRFDEDF